MNAMNVLPNLSFDRFIEYEDEDEYEFEDEDQEETRNSLN
jgi:hypothetical protein